MRVFFPLNLLRSVTPTERFSLGRELLASLVVFLVALPLCMGIAIACGAPPALGLVTGVVAGLVVGALSGSPLQVSGPAAGLVVLVWDFIRDFGVERLGLAVLVAGALQLAGGLLRLGRFLRAVSPAVIEGMLAGIGVLIVASQFHVMLDYKPRGSGLDNLLAIPDTLVGALGSSEKAAAGLSAALIAAVTLGVLLLGSYRAPKLLRKVPASLLAVLVASGLTLAFQLPVQRVHVPSDLLGVLEPPSAAALPDLLNVRLLLAALALALIASAETLLSAAAVDKMHKGERANFDRELAAQGVGNVLCGALGALPMTGVIVRSSANVQAGAQTRLSAIFHGFWLLLAVALLPSVLGLIPVSSLAAILVFTGCKLVKPAAIARLRRSGAAELAVYVITLLGVVATDLLTGVALGMAASVLKLTLQTTRLEVSVQPAQSESVEVQLAGTATFLQLPKLADALQGLAPGQNVSVRLDRLAFIDSACADLLKTWQETYPALGGAARVHWRKPADGAAGAAPSVTGARAGAVLSSS